MAKGLKVLLTAGCLLLGEGTTIAGRLHHEREYQLAWCGAEGGEAEYVLDDRTRVDCLTGEYAVEADFAPKWAEAVGQALYYSARTSKKPGILLIIEYPGDLKHLDRLKEVTGRAGITVWTVTPEVLKDRDGR